MVPGYGLFYFLNIYKCVVANKIVYYFKVIKCLKRRNVYKTPCLPGSDGLVLHLRHGAGAHPPH
jgi:hypothetical protein